MAPCSVADQMLRLLLEMIARVRLVDRLSTLAVCSSAVEMWREKKKSRTTVSEVI